MDIKSPSRSDLQQLLQPQTPPCASIYLAPSQNPAELSPTAIFLKNTTMAIEEALVERGRRSSEAREFVAPLRRLLDDRMFLHLHPPGVALFLNSDGIQAFRLRHAPDNSYWIGSRYRLLPLLADREASIECFLLTVSANEVRLLRCSDGELRPVVVEGLPKGLEDVVGPEHTTPARQIMNWSDGATYRGQGGQADRHKIDLRKYFLEVDRALRPHFQGSSAPLLFAGVDYLFPVFREVNSYAHLRQERICGNPDRMGADELRAAAAELLAEEARRRLEADAARFADSAGTGRTCTKPAEILTDAGVGAVDTLFVQAGRPLWGRFDDTTGAVAPTSQEDAAGCDLYDLAAQLTLAHGGEVQVVAENEVPGGGQIAALLRYAPVDTGATA